MHFKTLMISGGLALGGFVARADEADAPPLSPQEQLAKFTLPPGFEIQLVASEPEIQKPMNLNFDAAGRLWVTGTGLYPLAAKKDALGNLIPNFDQEWNGMSGAAQGEKPVPEEDGRDSVRILENFGADGRAGKITVFAEGLNIPIGVQPLPMERGARGTSALVFSIPAIWRLVDSDGDGTADLREKVYGNFGFRDTHGMSSNYLQWTDGWIYGCHGFANHSEILDGSGNTTVIDSGSTYRFRPDGSRFEIFGRGQTNPFGLTMDGHANLYSCDSHSKPAYLLLRGAHCEGIGKEHDGLGFLPPIMYHSHGSSAIAGIAHYSGEAWPEEYRENLFIGNPVTRKINRDRLEWQGATPKAVEMPDFLSCEDPWFRPIQLKLGPDGALYIADFYNPIIGHYEQPLFDPRRDRARGRIWRVVWKGDGAGEPAAMPDLTALDDGALREKFSHANLELRRLAMLTAQARGMELPEPPREPSAILGDGAMEISALLARHAGAPEGDSLTRHAVKVALRDRLADAALYGSEAVRGAAAADLRLLAEVSLAVPGEAAGAFVIEYLRGSGAPAEDRLGFVEAMTRTPNLSAELRRKGAEIALAILISGENGLVDRALPLLRGIELAEKSGPLEEMVRDENRSGGQRAAALSALAPLPSSDALAGEVLRNPASPAELMREAISILGASGDGEATGVLLEALAGAPTEFAVLIAAQLAAGEERAEEFLRRIEAGKASPLLLRNGAVAGALGQRSEALRSRAAALARDLPEENARLDGLIAARVAAFAQSGADHAKGAELFATHCAVCHKFKDAGGNLAPNLDGVGASRGAARLIEDILDPDRNVDPAFRMVTLTRNDGSKVSGIGLREIAGGQQLTGIDRTVIELPAAEISGPPEISARSFMPAVFEHAMDENELNSLVRFLLQP